MPPTVYSENKQYLCFEESILEMLWVVFHEKYFPLFEKRLACSIKQNIWNNDCAACMLDYPDWNMSFFSQRFSREKSQLLSWLSVSVFVFGTLEVTKIALQVLQILWCQNEPFA